MTNIAIPCKSPDPNRRSVIDEVLCRDRSTCQMCGATTNDTCPYDGVRVTLCVTLDVELEDGGFFEPGNLRTTCSTCAAGLQAVKTRRFRQGLNPSVSRPNRIVLLTQLRRATRSDQKAVFKWLASKFGHENA